MSSLIEEIANTSKDTETMSPALFYAIGIVG